MYEAFIVCLPVGNEPVQLMMRSGPDADADQRRILDQAKRLRWRNVLVERFVLDLECAASDADDAPPIRMYRRLDSAQWVARE